MSDEEKKIRYRNIIYSLAEIRNKQYTLYDSLEGMEKTIKSNLLINNAIPDNNIVNSCYGNVSSSTNNIIYDIIPSLQNKIDS